MIYLIFIPLALLFMPWVLARYVFTTKHTRELPYKQHAWYMWLAGALWFLAMTLPNVPISPETETTTMHTLGGAVAAVLFTYALKVYQIKFKEWWQPIAWLYLFVSALGVTNELFEFFLDRSNLADIKSGDEWWDLLANTIGGFIAFGVLQLIKRQRQR